MNPAKIRKELEAKEVFLIDAFDTIVAISCRANGYTTRRGVLEFLVSWKKVGKTLVLHSEAVRTSKFPQIAALWGVQGYIDHYFGKEFTGLVHQEKPNPDLKDFPRMLDALSLPLERAILITDKNSLDEYAARIIGLSTISIPKYSLDRRFDFRNLAYRVS